MCFGLGFVIEPVLGLGLVLEPVLEPEPAPEPPEPAAKLELKPN